MILYHFTTVSFLRPDGTPGVVDIDEHTLEPRGSDGLPTVVWLTTDPNPGGPDRENTNGGGWQYARIKLMIPGTDWKLHRWSKWRLRHFGPEACIGMDERTDELCRGICTAAEWRHKTQAWWIYFGSIPGTRFIAVDLIKNGSPWWQCTPATDERGDLAGF
jgi:hypothetical protein